MTRSIAAAIVRVPRTMSECSSLVGPWAIERGRVVTLLTLLPEASLVHIVTGMTRTADHRGLHDVLWADVTVGAADF